MKKTTLKLCFLAMLMILQMPFAMSQQNNSQCWNQFRGTDRNGACEYATLNQFSEHAPKLLWKKKLGDGFSEITVSGNRIYTMLSEKKDSVSGSEFIAAFDAKTGNEVWRTKVDSIFFDTFGDGPRSTPAIGDDKIFSLSSYGKLTASSKKNGKTVWQIDFVKEFGSTTPRWGFSSSPVLMDNSLIVEVGGTDSRAFMAFDKDSGKILWTKGDGNASYNSPVISEIDGQKNIIFANGSKLYALSTQGDTLWNYNAAINGPTAMPLVIDSNKIFVSDVSSPGFYVVEVKDNKATELIHGSSMKTDYSSAIYYNGYIYGFHVAALQCISAETGEKKWAKRGFGKGSLIRVGDQLLVFHVYHRGTVI